MYTHQLQKLQLLRKVEGKKKVKEKKSNEKTKTQNHLYHKSEEQMFFTTREEMIGL